MASELLEDISEKLTEEQGISVKKGEENGFEYTLVRVLSERGSSIIGRDIGSYYTLTLPEGNFDRRSCVKPLTGFLRGLVGQGSVLIAALGNPDITPDALGPLTAERILVTRHLRIASPKMFGSLRETILCRPGVLSMSGIESAQQIRAAAELTRPDCVIVIDALAGRDVSMLCRSIQIADTGISPGSGVGNDRQRISRGTLGIPVISVGVPTVADAFDEREDKKAGAMFVTPRDIDFRVRRLSRIIADAVNTALQPSLSREELISLTEE
ncbi:MAG: GPR endopeptidase [Eubacteriales bacterium]|nr:GPR endopeptidase [Eubacteriales bacterium]